MGSRLPVPSLFAPKHSRPQISRHSFSWYTRHLLPRARAIETILSVHSSTEGHPPPTPSSPSSMVHSRLLWAFASLILLACLFSGACPLLWVQLSCTCFHCVCLLNLASHRIGCTQHTELPAAFTHLQGPTRRRLCARAPHAKAPTEHGLCSRAYLSRLRQSTTATPTTTILNT